MARSLSAAALSSVGAFLGLGVSTPAHAGAWTEKAGEGKVILSARTASADDAFDGSGDPDLPSDFRKNDVELYVERGLTDDVTLVVQTSFVDLSDTGADISGLDDTQIGVQQRVFQDNQQVLSVAASAFVAGESKLTSGGVDGELRVLYGRSFTLGGKPGYFNVEAGYRWRANGFADQVRPDVTIGWSVSPDLTLMAQSFNIVSLGDGVTDYEGQQSKAQLSGVWNLSDRVGVQFGAFASVAGENTARERGLFTSLWLRF